MSDKYILDACALFGIFQIFKPNELINKQKLSKEVEIILLKCIAGAINPSNDIKIGIPVISISEILYKLYKFGFIDDFKRLYEAFLATPEIEILSYDKDIHLPMLDYLSKHQERINDYMKSTKKVKQFEIFDFLIYRISEFYDYDTIISRDVVFDGLYGLNRIW